MPFLRRLATLQVLAALAFATGGAVAQTPNPETIEIGLSTDHVMITAGFCRNCLGDWYREAAADRGITLGKDEARAEVYGMAPDAWKAKHQKEATPEQKAAVAAAQKHS